MQGHITGFAELRLTHRQQAGVQVDVRLRQIQLLMVT